MDERHVAGGADLVAALREFPVKLEVQVMARALRGGANVIAEQARTNVPVKTGALRDSIRVVRRTNKRTGYINLVVAAGSRKKGGPWYAHLVEFGAQPHEIRPRKAKSLFIAGLLRQLVQHPGVKPSGFMRRAFDSRAGDAITEVTRITARGVELLARRRARGKI